MSALPVHLLTGFLGSGKTTLLASLLRQPAFADTAVIVNELGEVGLDHLLVTPGGAEDVVLLDSGCLCCALGNSLQETLEDLWYRRVRSELPPFARVVVETTGIADPGPVAATLSLDSAIARHYRLGSIVTVVDAVHGDEHLARFDEARRQVAVADRIVVSKTDLADAEQRAALAARIHDLNPHAPHILAVAGAADAAQVFVDMLDADPVRMLARAPADEHDHEHEHEHEHHDHLAEHGIASVAIHLRAPLDWPRYAQWVHWMQQSFGERLLRMKGAVRMEDGSVQALHGVMRLFSAPAPLVALPPELGFGAIVVIAQHVSPALMAEAQQRIEGVATATLVS